MTAVDAEDLAMLATGFEAALRSAPDSGTGVASLFELGWGDVLAASPAQAASIAFAALGTTGSAAGLVDDVAVHALGMDPSETTAVILPAPAASAPPGRRVGGGMSVDGMASTRLRGATTVVVAIAGDDGVDLVTTGADALVADVSHALDPGQAYVRVRIDVPAGSVTPITPAGTWDAAVAAGRGALAHQLVAASRVMLDQAREHALDREQFGRPVASFQAVRHKLAEALVAIEGAAAVADAVDDGSDPLLAALAKSLAGKAALTTSIHAQQVLAGMGFTTDHPFQQWLKRTLVVDTVFGSARSLPAEIGAELLRRRHAPRLVELS